MKDENLLDLDYLIREYLNGIKAGIDQIYFGLLDNFDQKEKEDFLSDLKNQSDSLQSVLYKSVSIKTEEIRKLNNQLIKNNEILEQKVIQRTKEIKEIQNVTIFALARLAESRDNETGQHLIRIRNYCLEITKELRKMEKYKTYINDNYINNIYQSSPLHDIGKVGIPDNILLKPGKLTTEEFDLMKSHTSIGGKTLEDAENQLVKKAKESFLTMGKMIAYFHHEKWNGQGYPAGLKEEDIPLSARIVAVADVYDALTSKRVYKESYSHEKAHNIIIEGSGSHFDPEIIEAFLKVENKILEISKQCRDNSENY